MDKRQRCEQKSLQKETNHPETFKDHVAEALKRFSMDLVKLVCQYACYNSASKDTTPLLLSSFSFPVHISGGGRIYGIAVSSEGHVWVTKPYTIAMLTLDGVFFKEVAHKCLDAMGMAFSLRRRRAYVVDFDQGIVSVLGKNGDFLKVMNSTKLLGPCYIAVDNKKQLIFITESSTGQVKVLTLKGQLVRSFGIEKMSCYLRGVAVNSQGEVGVVDYSKWCVLVFDSDGLFLREFSIENGSPWALAVDAMDNWIVSYSSRNWIKIFTKEGDYLTSFATNQVSKSNSIFALCVDPQNRILAGCDHDEIQVWGFDS
jgi:hypothetical protein